MAGGTWPRSGERAFVQNRLPRALGAEPQVAGTWDAEAGGRPAPPPTCPARLGLSGLGWRLQSTCP